MSLEAAKRALGIARDRVVLLSIASEYKFESRIPPSFLDLVVPVLDEQESAILFVVGPTNSGRWHKANKLTAGHVRPVGLLSDPTPYRDAADIYLDSTPCGSITSLLESAAIGTPCLAYVGGRDSESLLVSDPPLVGDAILRAKDQDEYRYLLRRLISEPEFRTRVGGGLAAQVLDAHSDDSWRSRLNELYQQLGNMDRVKQTTPSAVEFPASGIDRELVGLATGRHGPLAVVDILGLFRGELDSLRWQALFGRTIRLLRALSRRSHLHVTQSGNSSIPPRWWPIADRFLVR
jgi:hypothetical protein